MSSRAIVMNSYGLVRCQKNVSIHLGGKLFRKMFNRRKRKTIYFARVFHCSYNSLFSCRWNLSFWMRYWYPTIRYYPNTFPISSIMKRSSSWYELIYRQYRKNEFLPTPIGTKRSFSQPVARYSRNKYSISHFFLAHHDESSVAYFTFVTRSTTSIRPLCYDENIKYFWRK